MHNQESHLDDLRLTARVRRKELKTRIIIAFFGFCMLWYAIGPVFSLVWLPLVICSQVYDFWAWSAVNRQWPSGFPKAKYRQLLIASAQASAVYSLIAVFLWYFGDTSARVFAFLWFGGSVLHVTLHMHHERGTYLAGVSSHAAYFFGIPILGAIGGIGDSRADAIMILIAVALYSGHLVAAFRSTRRFAGELTSARQQAEEKQLEAEKANKAKSDFLASMSHEIRTPLNGVLGMAESLRLDNLPQASHEKVDILHDSGLILLRLLNDILDLSKIEAGRVELENHPVDLGQIAGKVMKSHQHVADEKGLRLHLNFEDGLEVRRMSDELRLLQILNNLLSNAIKFTDEGEVCVDVKGDLDSGDVLICVRDTGIGMTVEQLAMVLEPFRQADSTITRRYGGTGLGLTIVNGLVKAMGGELSLTSVLNEGTEFVVRLPLLINEDEKDEVRSSSDGWENTAEFSGLHVLVADDHPVNRMVLENYLATTGASVFAVRDGEEAVQAVRDHEFDLVLMDITMPGMGGAEAMEMIQEIASGQGRSAPPVIAVTGHVFSHETDKYIEEGFFGYLPKPVSLSDLCRVMGEATDATKKAAPRMSA